MYVLISVILDRLQAQLHALANDSSTYTQVGVVGLQYLETGMTCRTPVLTHIQDWYDSSTHTYQDCCDSIIDRKDWYFSSTFTQEGLVASTFKQDLPLAFDNSIFYQKIYLFYSVSMITMKLANFICVSNLYT